MSNKKDSEKGMSLSTQAKTIMDLNSVLTCKLHQQIRTHESGNIVFSPYCVTSLLGMVKQGAKGLSLTELENLHEVPCKNEVFLKGFISILSALKEVNDGWALGMATQIFLMPGIIIRKQFSDTLKKYFQSGIEQIDFTRRATETAETRVNRWAEDWTNNKIENIVAPGTFSDSTQMVLTSAVYFIGKWKYAFSRDQTFPSSFYTSELETIEVHMMYSRGDCFPYAIFPELDAEAVALPIKGDRLWMITYVPRQRNGLKKLEANMKASAPGKVLSQNPFDIMFFMPKFTVECNVSLSKDLQELGLKSLFSETESDFSGIDKCDTQISISKVIQKTIVEVNETGSEKFEYTTPFPGFSCLPPAVHADRPFYFQLYDSQTCLILLSGSVVEPTLVLNSGDSDDSYK